MSWITKLSETYDKCEMWVGDYGEDGERPLLPLCHVTVNAHVEVIINQDGEFQRARLITDRKEATSIIPSSEASASKVGIKPEHHPLCDKLQYLAGDFADYGGEVTIGFKKDPKEPYHNFIHDLTNWCDSEFSHPMVRAVLRYVEKGTLVRDLANFQILLIGEDGKLLPKEKFKKDKNSGETIFSTVNGEQDNTIIRWIVEPAGYSERLSIETKVWRDKTLWESWKNYYLSSKSKEPLCFVTGEEVILSNNHPRAIRSKGDGTKIISSNDGSGFTFRGRFADDKQAYGLGLEASQKAHNALQWLIGRQGKVFMENDGKDPGLTVLAWAVSDIKVPQPVDEPADILGFNELTPGLSAKPDLAEEFARKLKNKIMGYGAELTGANSVQIISLDSATAGKGRLAIVYYQELDVSDYLKRLNKWHEECAWMHKYRFKMASDELTGVTKRQYFTFVGAPAPIDICEAAFGKRADDKLRKATIVRLLPCIIDGMPIPRDLVESTIRRASNRVGIKDKDDKKNFGDDEYTWNKTLSIACSLFKKYNAGKEHYEMALDPSRKTRDYLYGRLLALADNLEAWALRESGEGRETNAARLMQRFAEHPNSTWRQIELALRPYIARLGKKANGLLRTIDEVVASFDDKDFLNDKRLSGEFLLGYHCQREYLRPSVTATETEPESK